MERGARYHDHPRHGPLVVHGGIVLPGKGFVREDRAGLCDLPETVSALRDHVLLDRIVVPLRFVKLPLNRLRVRG